MCSDPLKTGVIAVLGPTNTGKTHLAMERMMAYKSGMIGFPLRLLARENYERAIKIKGFGAVALITGEEKILPAEAQYYICTVEAMPMSEKVEFVAVDEIQMCADQNRGHIFSDRLLNARGSFETMFLGSETMRPLISKLIKNVEFRSRPRFSTLKYSGEKNTIKLPKRSAIVAFSVTDVYRLAELVRRQLGGAAVVMGGLSPRARNSQIEMYEAGEVDYIVATDAIGMGLNMDIGHVAFAATNKFDGRSQRILNSTELAQIAGRAGRYIQDGTFGTTDSAFPIPNNVISDIENNQFPALKRLIWRNSELDFSEVGTLISCLGLAPRNPSLVRIKDADDENVLRKLLSDESISSRAKGSEAIKLLWEVCQVPDFVNTMSDSHTNLLAQIYKYLSLPPFTLSEEWMNFHVSRLDRTDGNLAHLTNRMGAIRTWTYVSCRNDWMKNAVDWQRRTRKIEDRLSDALNECLTKSFVDRSTTELLRKIEKTPDILAAVRKNGEVIVEGHIVGNIKGFCFSANSQVIKKFQFLAAKIINAAISKVVKKEIERRVNCLLSDCDDAFSIKIEGSIQSSKIVWEGESVGQLVKGKNILRPGVIFFSTSPLTATQRQKGERRLTAWIRRRIDLLFHPIFRLPLKELSGVAKGLCFQLFEGLGSIEKNIENEQIKELSKSDRNFLRKYKIKVAKHSIFVKSLLKSEIIRWRSVLWVIFCDEKTPVFTPSSGCVSLKVDQKIPLGFYEAIGFRVLGSRAIRIDILERIASTAWIRGRKRPFPIENDLLSLAGCSSVEMAVVLGEIGFKKMESDGQVKFLYVHVRFKQEFWKNKSNSRFAVFHAKKSKVLINELPRIKSSNYTFSKDIDRSPFAILKTFKPK